VQERNHLYKLGLPAWAFPGWNNVYFNNTPSALTSYASVFNAVEGNTTFYSTPDDKTVAQWQQSVDGRDFQFCFKLPKSVTHTTRPNLHDLDYFLRQIEPLKKHIGPLLLQFPATTGPAALPTLENLVDQLPGNYRYVIEVPLERSFVAIETTRKYWPLCMINPMFRYWVKYTISWFSYD